MTVGFFNRKNNVGPLQPAVGFQFDFDDDRPRVTRVDLAHCDTLAVRLPLWQRMVSALRSGPLTQVALATQLDAKQDSIKKVVDRSRGRFFVRVTGDDGIARIALSERRAV